MRVQRFRSLHALAARYGVLPGFLDASRRRREAAPEVLLAALRLLGCPVRRLDDVPEALTAARLAEWQRGCEPVVVAWDGLAASLDVRLEAPLSAETAACHLRMEDGAQQDWRVRLTECATRRAETIAGRRFVLKRVPLPSPLPLGYHRLVIELRDRVFMSALVIASPSLAHPGPEASVPRTWGVFAPVYALASSRSWGSGSFTELRMLSDIISARGGHVIATLPMLAAFLDRPFEPSPYAPASRLCWSEFYLDVDALPERPQSAAARALLRDPAFLRQRERLARAPLVDYQRGMALKRRILEPLAARFFAHPSPERQAAFRAFLESHPHVEDYARFRAVGEREGRPWHTWPARLRDGMLHHGDADPDAVRYHHYVQWNAHEQLAALSAEARSRGPGLYLDLPLGVHAAGYDVWRHRTLFAHQARVGAPPDPVFAGGQDWGFPPLVPAMMREQGYAYTRACLRHHLAHAGILRLDHVMALHRLYWIPPGCDARQGVYVRYPAEELYAVLCLESRRARALIIGENLGTVPPEVNESMRRHQIHRMLVLQYELATSPRRMLSRIAPDTVASLNTHDMPPFMASWRGMDLPIRVALGLIRPGEAARERRLRSRLHQRLLALLVQRGYLTRREAATPDSVLRACLAFLSASPARVVLVNLEDLWLEHRPQNVPGTWREYPNWRRKLRFPLEALAVRKDLGAILDSIQRWRTGAAR